MQKKSAYIIDGMNDETRRVYDGIKRGKLDGVLGMERSISLYLSFCEVLANAVPEDGDTLPTVAAALAEVYREELEAKGIKVGRDANVVNVEDLAEAVLAEYREAETALDGYTSDFASDIVLAVKNENGAAFLDLLDTRLAEMRSAALAAYECLHGRSIEAAARQDGRKTAKARLMHAVFEDTPGVMKDDALTILDEMQGDATSYTETAIMKAARAIIDEDLDEPHAIDTIRSAYDFERGSRKPFLSIGESIVDAADAHRRAARVLDVAKDLLDESEPESEAQQPTD